MGLPDFRSPPLNEVACGVYFGDIPKMLMPHFGLLWKRLPEDYEKCQEHAPLSVPTEGGDVAHQISIQFATKPPLPRVWFMHNDQSSIIQVQRNAFFYNWKKASPASEYPRYPRVIDAFFRHLETFTGFVEDEQLGDFEPAMCELKYSNLIFVDEISTDKFGDVFPDFKWREDPARLLRRLQGENFQFNFPLPEGGRLYAVIRKAIANPGKRRVFVFELSVRGKPGVEGNRTALKPWFDVARGYIVRSFADLTSSEIQSNVWNRTDL